MTTNNPPHIYDKKPDVRTLEPGSYQWCSCGYSEKQPFCDGAHIRHGMMPVPLDINEEKKVALCNCKMTQNPPYCDGAHAKL